MSDSDRSKTDYEYSRDTLYDLIQKGRNALEDMIEVARESEHPRAFEVLSGLIKNVADVNDKLMDLNKKHKDISTKETLQIPGSTTNNLFVGSTTELQKMLHDNIKLKQDNVIDITPKLSNKE
jgi:membrane-associated HD superfamily phosphohydrolase|tara:strand:+ start:1006 stop:1374 length:369 start_codon:yes stop_codon:yes gene_type:complete